MKDFQILLQNQALALVTGPDKDSILQGLVTADVSRIRDGELVYSCLLTPQGKFLDDFFLFQHPQGIALEAPKARLAEIAKRLQMYKLKAQVALAPMQPQLAIWVSSQKPAKADFAFQDPRHAALGWRVYGAAPTELRGSEADYQALRTQLGVPDASLDLVRGQSTLFDNGMDRIGAIAWEKGCYMGQEITARMKYRGLKKWDLLPLRTLDQPATVGEPILQDEKEVGHITSVADQRAMARVRMDAMTSGELVESDPLRLASGAFEWIPLDYMR